MIRFRKAHACGNDFLIVDEDEVKGRDRAALTRALCARTTGIGADGVEYLRISGDRSGRIQLFNADGSVAEISGNGTRCVAAWMAQEQQLSRGESVTLATDAGERRCQVEAIAGPRFTISTGMGVPTVEPRMIRLADGREIAGAVVSTGNPHFVIQVDSDDFSYTGRSWKELGREICTHGDFPQRTNVEFVYMRAPGAIEIRIYERGVGPTSSSGTGTSAAAAASIALQDAATNLTVLAPGGAQDVKWHGSSAELTLTGPAELIASGEAFFAENYLS